MFHPSNNSTALTARGTLEIYLTEAECLSLKMLDQMAKALRMDPNEMKELFEEVVQSKGWIITLLVCSQIKLLAWILILMPQHSPSASKSMRWMASKQRKMESGFSLNPSDVLEVALITFYCLYFLLYLSVFLISFRELIFNDDIINYKTMWDTLLIISVIFLSTFSLFNIFLFFVVSQILTNGIYCNIEHCATINSMKERLSFATFCNPKLDGEFGPTPNLITPESPALFKRINVVDHLKELFSIELWGK